MSDFKGFKYGNIYKLANGQIWQQTEPYIYLYLAVMPEALIWNSGGAYRMKVDGIDHAVSVQLVGGSSPAAADTTASARAIPSVIESRIVSTFDGFQMGNIYRLENGQVWEQTDTRIRVAVRVNPRVTIWKDGGVWRMRVADIDTVIRVRPVSEIGREASSQDANSQISSSPVEVVKDIIAGGVGQLIAADGTFLGYLGSEFDANSIANSYGKFGSEFSPTSIFNQFGKYGGEFSRLSPYNALTSTPPVIVVEGKVIMYVTVNETLWPRVHPDVLRALLRN